MVMGKNHYAVCNKEIKGIVKKKSVLVHTEVKEFVINLLIIPMKQGILASSLTEGITQFDIRSDLGTNMA